MFYVFCLSHVAERMEFLPQKHQLSLKRPVEPGEHFGASVFPRPINIWQSACTLRTLPVGPGSGLPAHPGFISWLGSRRFPELFANWQGVGRCKSQCLQEMEKASRRGVNILSEEMPARCVTGHCWRAKSRENIKPASWWQQRLKSRAEIVPK